MSIWQESHLVISVQSQPHITLEELLQSLLLACGGVINSSYFSLLDMEISECLYHLYLWIDMKKKESGKEDKLKDWGIDGTEWLPINEE